MEIALVLGLLVVAIVLFATEILSIDLVALLLIIALVISGILTPQEAFSGFSNDIIIILASMFIISGALQQTGVLDIIGSWLHKLAGNSPNRLLLVLMSTAGGLSAFMNNTTVASMMLLPVTALAKKIKVSASKFLMPLAFASILGGTCTLIGTSTNVAVSGYIARLGLKPVGLFEITPVGLIIVAVGIAYMMLVGRRLLPEHKAESLADEYDIREYLSEIIVLPKSPLVGQRIFESDLAKLEVRILKVLRGKETLFPTSRTRIEPKDVLLVEAKVPELMKVKDTAGIEIKPEFKLGDLESDGEDVRMAEVMITPQSNLAGRSLKETRFRQRYGLIALAIYRHGRSLHEKLGGTKLRFGDLLLVQGPMERIEAVRRDPNLWILDDLGRSTGRRRKALYTTLFFVAALVVGGFGWLPLSIAFLAAAVCAVLVRCISVEEAYASIHWKLLILIGGMTSFGIAMEKTGTAAFLAKWIVAGMEPLGTIGILAGLFVLTMLLTQPMSNAAAALVVLPIALSTAETLGVNPRTFAIAIMLAASISLIAPFEPSCILVYGPGKYKFRDFVRVGTGLTLILLVLLLFLIPIFWPLEPSSAAASR